MHAMLLRFSSYVPVLILKVKHSHKFSHTNNFSQINKFFVHDVKHGSSATWLFQDVLRCNSKYPEKLASWKQNNKEYLIYNIKCKYKNWNHYFEVSSSDKKTLA